MLHSFEANQSSPRLIKLNFLYNGITFVIDNIA
jgi:hypothetical protein